MTIIIDLHDECPAELLDQATIVTSPTIDKDLLLLIDLSQAPYYHCQSLILTCQGQLFLTAENTSQLFHLVENYHGLSYERSVRFTCPKQVNNYKKLWPYCVNQHLYFSVTHKPSDHRHWCAFHYVTCKETINHRVHLRIGKCAEIILPMTARTENGHLKQYQEILDEQHLLWKQWLDCYKRSNIEHFPSSDAILPHERFLDNLIIQNVENVLETVDHYAPDTLDAITKRAVLKTYCPKM